MKIIHKIGVIMAAALTLSVSSASALTNYLNNFSEENLPVVTGAPWSLDTDNSVLKYVQPAGSGVVVGTAAVEVLDAVGDDLIASTWFTVNNIQGSGTAITTGFGVFGSTGNFLSSGGASYYLADWTVGGGGTMGGLRILPLPARASVTASPGNAGVPTIGETYELRLTAVYVEGALQMTLAVFDESGIQIGTAATATDTAPLTGGFFGYRNRTAHATHLLDFDYRVFSVGTNAPPLPNKPQVEFTNLNPAPFATFQPAAGGLQFTVSTDPTNVILVEDIELILNGETIPTEELIVTGASPSFNVSYNGLEPGEFYTAIATATDAIGPATRTWRFNTLVDSGIETVEDVQLNQSTNDALQGLLGVNSYIGTLPEGGSVVRLTDATTASTPATTVILSPDELVTITWDLTGIPVESAETLPALTRLDLWLAGFDYHRASYDGEFATSLDGENFTPVPNTRFASPLTYTGNPIEGVPGSQNGTGTSRYNLVSYHFAPNNAGFRYLRFISYGYDLGEDTQILRQPRFVELDAIVTQVPVGPLAPVLNFVRDGDQLILTWDDAEAQLQSAPEITGEWSNVEGATSPHPVDMTLNPGQFFQLIRND